MKGSDRLEVLGADGGDHIRMDVREIGWQLGNGFMWLRIRASDGLL